MISRRSINQQIVYDILQYEYEDELQTICNALSSKYQLLITDKLEGPGTTIWKLSLEGQNFSLVNGGYGNFLRPSDDRALIFIEQEFDIINELL